MNKGKRTLVMCTVALTAIMSSVPSFAAIESYVTEKDGKKYEYKISDLKNSIIDDTDLINQYKAQTPIAIKDTKQGYIDYRDIVDAIIFATGKFDINEYTESSIAKKIELVDVTVVDPSDPVDSSDPETDGFEVVDIK